jgi:hypothetical protein
MRGTPPKFDYSGITFKVIEKPEPLHEIMAAFKTLTPRQMLVLQLNGATHQTTEGLRNNFYVAGVKGVRTETEDGIMRVWRTGVHTNGNGKSRHEVIHKVEERRHKVRA